MDPERWHRISSLFTAIAERPEAEWPRLLDRLCDNGDSGERREVERLLDADRRGTGYFDRPAARLADGGPSPEVLAGGEPRKGRPTRAGSYRLLRPIGRGAMSVVYLAVRDDDAYRRRVAVKLIRPGIDDPSAVRRFLAERQILAGLEHPNVARLYGGGETADGRPYLAMELVDGLPITAYCDRRTLGIEARLRLFLDVCGAVQHAHQSLLVHRDLKPGNILVTSEGTAKLLDFGIAKLLAPRDGIEPRTTRTGQRPMTPSYASPEQVRGDAITTASDVYSLGVLLFELLTGLLPYHLATSLPHELEAAICEGEPRSPSGTFAAKAGAATRETATGSAAATVAAAADGRGPASPEDRAAARGGSPMELRRRLRGDLDTIVARALAKEPERRYPSARQLAADVERHLAHRPIVARQDHLGYRAAKFARRHRTVLAVAALALTAVALLVAVVRRQAGLLESRQASTDRVTEIFLERLVVQDSVSAPERPVPRVALDASLAEMAPRLGEDRAALAETLETMGWVYRRAGLMEDARWLFEESLDQRLRAGESGEALAGSRHGLGGVLLATGELAEGEAVLRRAIALFRSGGGGGSYGLAEALETLGRHRRAMGYLDDAETLLTESLAVKRTVCPRAAWTARALSDLGWLHLERQRPALAEPLMAEAAELRQRLSATHRESLRTLEDEAVTAYFRGDARRAGHLFAQAVAARRERLGDHDASVSAGMVWQARALLPQGRHQEAVELLRAALGIRNRLGLGDGPEQADLLKYLGFALAGTGEGEAGSALLRNVMAQEAGWISPHHPRVAVSRLYLGKALHACGDLAGAESQYRLASADLEAHPEWDFGTGAEPRLAQARLLLERGEPEQAVRAAQQALDLLRQRHPAGHWRIALAESLMATALARIGQSAEAAPSLERGLGQLARTLGPEAAESFSETTRPGRLRQACPTLPDPSVHSEYLAYSQY